LLLIRYHIVQTRCWHECQKVRSYHWFYTTHDLSQFVLGLFDCSLCISPIYLVSKREADVWLSTEETEINATLWATCLVTDFTLLDYVLTGTEL